MATSDSRWDQVTAGRVYPRRPIIVAIVLSHAATRYVAYTEAEAYYIRDTVGGEIEWR